MTYFSQFGQDKFVVEELFPGKRDGVFVEVGAHDGISGSNTFALERLGWTGLLVEANPDMEEKLRKNRTAKIAMVAVSDGIGLRTFTKLTGPCDVLSGLSTDYDPRHRDRIYREQKAHGGKIEFVQVECTRLESLLRKEHLHHIDYLSIDTEGSELSVLKGIDWSDVSIDVISVENNYGEKDVQEYLEQQGYTHINRVGIDDFYRNLTAAESVKAEAVKQAREAYAGMRILTG